MTRGFPMDMATDTRRTTATIAAVFLLGLTGCQVPEIKLDKTPPRPVANVNKITLLAQPMAVNLDYQPGPDALRVEVFLFHDDKPQPVLGQDTVQFLLYEWPTGAASQPTDSPYLVWTYPPERLAGHITRNPIGWGYAVDLKWGAQEPRSNAVTVVAVYRFADGHTISSSPVTIPVHLR
jgi:hypothetical protein